MQCILDPHVAKNGVNGLHEEISPQSLSNGERNIGGSRAVRGQFQCCFVRSAYSQLAIAVRLTARDSPRAFQALGPTLKYLLQEKAGEFSPLSLVDLGKAARRLCGYQIRWGSDLRYSISKPNPTAILVECRRRWA
jgi:hypothetical protein